MTFGAFMGGEQLFALDVCRFGVQRMKIDMIHPRLRSLLETQIVIQLLETCRIHILFARRAGKCDTSQIETRQGKVPFLRTKAWDGMAGNVPHEKLPRFPTATD